MRLALCVLPLAASLVLAQTTPEWKAFYEKQEESRKRGAEALQLERERRKASLCSQSTNGNAGISTCLSSELKTTEAHYLTYVRSIGALLRLVPPEEARPGSGAGTVRLPFDDAEAAWQSYRDKACTAMRVQWEGSQSGVAQQTCRLDLTWNHMNELDTLYNGLWH
jgi:hypothetical protein